MEASNVCFELLGQKPITHKRNRETFTFPIIHFYVKNGCATDDILANTDAVNLTFQKRYNELSATCRTRTGARDLLSWLNAKGVTCIVLSNHIRPSIESHMHRLKLEGFFQHVSSSTDDGQGIIHKTSKLERLSAYMVKRGFAPEDAFIVGDSLEEPEIGRHLGLKTISITQGNVSEERLRKNRPDHLIHALKEIKPILQADWGL